MLHLGLTLSMPPPQPPEDEASVGFFDSQILSGVEEMKQTVQNPFLYFPETDGVKITKIDYFINPMEQSEHLSLFYEISVPESCVLVLDQLCFLTDAAGGSFIYEGMDLPEDKEVSTPYGVFLLRANDQTVSAEYGSARLYVMISGSVKLYPWLEENLPKIIPVR